ncbi:MAG: protein-export chaperone SecB [Magnetococcales bacterium]|nr:protein-export chaperone SecB [Magnetococcales bacterium]
MAETDQDNEVEAEGKPEQGSEQAAFHVEKLYIKDLSYESPNSPDIFQNLGEPKVELNLDTGATQKGPEHYEATLHVTVTVKNAEKTLFIIEISYGGIFMIRNFAKEQVDALLGIECPTIIFPYVRRVISDLVSEGGFKPLILDPINFPAIFHQARAEEKAQEEGATDPAQVN